jgi:heterodisulfide reductase subunit A
VVTTRPGVYAAGCATGPKDIPDSVYEGSGAAALALSHLRRRHWPEPVEVEPMEGIETPRVGVFVCHCGSNIAGVVDVQRVVDAATKMPDVVYARIDVLVRWNTQRRSKRRSGRNGQSW